MFIAGISKLKISGSRFSGVIRVFAVNYGNGDYIFSNSTKKYTKWDLEFFEIVILRNHAHLFGTRLKYIFEILSIGCLHTHFEISRKLIN